MSRESSRFHGSENVIRKPCPLCGFAIEGDNHERTADGFALEHRECPMDEATRRGPAAHEEAQ